MTRGVRGEADCARARGWRPGVTMDSTGVRQHDRGAAAVEFALVSVLLFTLLFGIIQYGFLFFQYQAAAATAHEGARLAALGINDCSDFGRAVQDRGTANGLPAGAVTEVHVTYPDPDNPGGVLD